MTAFPAFFAAAPVIRMQDPLAALLGAADEGFIDYRFQDAVRLAGHSCPTVAAAFLMVRAGLKAIYGSETPRRGEIRVDLREVKDSGVAGVMAAVAALVTGAADEGGFKGLAGRYERRRRLFFGQDIAGTIRLTRLDSGAAATVSARIERVAGDPRMGELLPRCLDGSATADEAKMFGTLWQDRVRRLLVEHADDGEVIVVSAPGQGDNR